ncbi:hypothetical protein [Veillonella sp. R32]
MSGTEGSAKSLKAIAISVVNT